MAPLSSLFSLAWTEVGEEQVEQQTLEGEEVEEEAEVGGPRARVA